MAWSIVGTTNLTTMDFPADQTISVTPPSGSNAFVVGGTYYIGFDAAMELVTPAFGTTQNLISYQGGTAGTMSNFLAYGTVTSTGSAANLRIKLTGTSNYEEGPACTMVWLSVDNNTDWVREAKVINIGTSGATGSVTSTTSDLVLAWHGKSGGTEDLGQTGWTAQGTAHTIRSASQAVFSANSPGASSTTATMNGAIGYPALGIISIKNSGGGGAQTLSPPLTTNTSTLYTPVVTRGTSGQTIAPPVTTNSQTFYSPTVSRMPDGARGQYIVDNTGTQPGGSGPGIMYNDVELPADANKWFHFVITTPPSTGTLTINADGTFTFVGPNPETMYYQLYVDNVAVGSPQLVTLYSTGQTISPPLLTNTSTVFAPSLSLGAVVLQPPLTTNTTTAFSPSIVLGTVVLNAPLVTNTSTVFSPTVSLGTITVQVPLVTNTSSVYTPVVSTAGTVVVAPPLLTNTQTFFGPTVAPTGAVVLSAPLVSNSSFVYPPRVTRAGDPPISTGTINATISVKIGLSL